MKKQFFFKMLSAFLIFIIALSFIFIIYTVVSVNRNDTFGIGMFIVVSGSMEDTINEGDLIITKRVSQDKLNVGDIITFISSDPTILGKKNTHRIFEIKDGVYYTKGDANPVPDKYPVKYEDVCGKVIINSHLGGEIIRTLSRPLILLLFVILPTLAIALFDIIKSVKSARSAMRKFKLEEDTDQKELGLVNEFESEDHQTD